MEYLNITMEDLMSLLDEQKETVARYITRNLSCYHWRNLEQGDKVDSDRARSELISEVRSSGYPDDFNILRKYLKI